MKMSAIGGLAIAAMIASHSANAIMIDWADWTVADPGAGTASGTLAGMSLTVDYMGPAMFGAQTAGGTYYYTEGVPAPYTGGDVDNAPPDPDILQLSLGGTSMISFSQTVVDPVLALVSWNTNTVDFGRQIEIVSNGDGFFGTTGNPILNGSNTGFFGAGEVHGVVRILGNVGAVALVAIVRNIKPDLVQARSPVEDLPGVLS